LTVESEEDAGASNVIVVGPTIVAPELVGTEKRLLD
jgi:hypothetical protein